MSIGIECLLTDDAARAAALALRLEALNQERREVEARMRDEAFAAFDGLDFDATGQPVLCVHGADWHPGVVGLVAGRLRERYSRPAAAFAAGPDGMLRGSVRSVPEVHVRDALAEVAARRPGLIVRFGGHAMAAGLTLAPDRLAAFEVAFGQAVLRQLGGALPEDVLWTDGALPPGQVTLDFARRLRAAGPWGAGFAEPVFDGQFAVRARRVVGETHLRLTLAAGDAEVEAIAFGAAGLRDALGAQVALAYRVQVNEWNGRESAQLVAEAFSPDLAAR